MTYGCLDYSPAHGMHPLRLLKNLYGLAMARGKDRTGFKFSSDWQMHGAGWIYPPGWSSAELKVHPRRATYSLR